MGATSRNEGGSGAGLERSCHRCLLRARLALCRMWKDQEVPVYVLPYPSRSRGYLEGQVATQIDEEHRRATGFANVGHLLRPLLRLEAAKPQRKRGAPLFDM